MAFLKARGIALSGRKVVRLLTASLNVFLGAVAGDRLQLFEDRFGVRLVDLNGLRATAKFLRHLAHRLAVLR